MGKAGGRAVKDIRILVGNPQGLIGRPQVHPPFVPRTVHRFSRISLSVFIERLSQKATFTHNPQGL
jgi:hypothetical protein